MAPKSPFWCRNSSRRRKAATCRAFWSSAARSWRPWSDRAPPAISAPTSIAADTPKRSRSAPEERATAIRGGAVHGPQCVRRRHAAIESRAGGAWRSTHRRASKASRRRPASTSPTEVITFLEKNARPGRTRTKGTGMAARAAFAIGSTEISAGNAPDGRPAGERAFQPHADHPARPCRPRRGTEGRCCSSRRRRSWRRDPGSRNRAAGDPSRRARRNSPARCSRCRSSTPSASSSHSRYMPDRRDLNRSFPGSDHGSLASVLADLFMREVVLRSQYGIDLHTRGAPSHQSAANPHRAGDDRAAADGRRPSARRSC